MSHRAELRTLNEPTSHIDTPLLIAILTPPVEGIYRGFFNENRT